MFLSSEQKYERKDGYFKKDLQKEHFNQSLVKEQLKKQGIFLSLMEKRKKCTDQCKSLPFQFVQKLISIFQIGFFKLS